MTSDPNEPPAVSTLEHVAVTSRNYQIYREPNGAGGYRYWSDAVGGGVVVWDTCLVSEDELLTCIVEERKRHMAAAAPGRELPAPAPAPALVVDVQSGLCRHATQEDVRLMEMMGSYYQAMMSHAREAIEKDNWLQKRIKSTGSEP